MKILEFPTSTDTPCAVALGFFDGVHPAHKKILEAAAREKMSGLTPCVFTFDSIPSKGTSGLLTTRAERISLIAESGIELFVSAPFVSLRDMSAEEFVSDVLIDKLKAKAVFCGYNYRFGKGAQADAETLRTLLEERGAKLFVLDEITTEEGVLSSTLIRNLLKEGKVKKANSLLLRNYSLSGKVIHGNALGRTIDTPTLNIKVSPDKLLPRFGVYASRVTLGDKVYDAVTNIGLKPTVGSDIPTVEAYLLDVSGDFYEESATVELVDFLRPEQKFSSLEELKIQIEKDIENTKSILM